MGSGPEERDDETKAIIKNTQVRRLDLNLLMIFAAIGRHRKLSAAADELFLTKSAISHALNRLRDIFHDPLFVREHGGVQPTPRASTLLPKVNAIIRLSNDVLMLDQAFDAKSETRQLRVGCVEYVEALMGPELIRLCRERAPNMRLQFVSMTRSDIVETTATYKVDLGLGSFMGDTAGLDVEALRQDEYVVVAKPLPDGETMTRERYLAAAHVSISSEGRPQRMIEGVMTTLGVARQISCLAPHYITAFGVVAKTDCLLTIPRLLTSQFAAPLGLAIYPFPFPYERQTISLLAPPLARHDPAIQWLMQQCREAASRLD